MMHDWYSPWHGGTPWEAWLMFSLMIASIAALVVAVVYLVRAASGTSSASTAAGTSESPRDILKRRYAAGEIDREEYQQKLRDL